MTNEMSASILHCAWRKVDIKLAIDGEMHVLRWRRSWFIDEVLFDDRRVATTKGLFGRDSTFGLALNTLDDTEVRLLFSVDSQPDWNDMNGDMKPRGVRLDTADATLIAEGSLGPKRPEPFRELYDRSIKAIGLS